MTYQVKFPENSPLFNSIQKGLELDIYIDPEMKSCGAFCYSFQNAGALMKVKDIADSCTYVHEFVHACQVLSGPPTPGNEMFRFNSKSLERYLTSKGIPFERWCAEYVEDLLENLISRGLYDREDFLTEFPAYYVENAFGGEKVLEAIWADTQKLIKKPDSFWTRVQKEKRKEKRREWIKNNLIYFPLPTIAVVLILVISFVTRKDQPIFYNPFQDLNNPVNQVIQK